MNTEFASSLKARRAGMGQFRCVILLLVLFLSLLPGQAARAVPGDLEDTFLEPNPSGAAPTDPGFSVGSFIVQPDGKIIVGGHFFVMNQQGRDRLARLNSDGSLDASFAKNFYISHSVYTLVPLSGGDFLAAGSFTAVNGSTPVNHIMRLDGGDGSLDTSFTSRIDVTSGGSASSVSVIVPLSDGDFLVGGNFASVGGAPRGNIARLNADGSLDAAFMNGLGGANGGVRSIVLQPDGKILITGFFTQVNGVPRGRIARLNADGSLDTTFMNGMNGANDIVGALALQPDGKVLAGGFFTAMNGSPRAYLARLNADGSLDSAFLNGIVGPSDVVRSITRQNDGRLLITGYFTSVNGTPRGYLARLNADGSNDTNFMLNQPGADASVLVTKAQSDGKILIGGTFTHVNGASRNLIARLTSFGDLDSEFLMAGANHEVNAVVPQPGDGKILVGGRFNVMNGQAQEGISRLNPDGSTDLDFLREMPGVTGGTGRVNTIALQPDGKILLGGDFDAVAGRGANNIARLNPSGSVDLDFNTGNPMGTDGEVHSIVVQPDGKILVGGNFHNAGDGLRSHLARFNPDGMLDRDFASVSLDSWVYSVAVQPDGKIIIAGDFKSVNGQPRGRVARLNADGTLDTGYLNGVTGASNVVRWVDIDRQGNTIIGGWFTSVNDQPFNRIARLSKTDGSPDPTFLNGLTGPDNGIRALEVQPDGSILIGGEFFQVNDVECKHIALLNPNGSLASSFGCSGAVGINGGWVNSVANSSAGFLIGGDFTQVRGAERGRIARLEGSPNAPRIFLPMLQRQTQ